MLRNTWLYLCVALALVGCTIVGDDPSPYETAVINIEVAQGVGDGETPVVATVTGDLDAKLTLSLTGDASFVGHDENLPKEKTVLLDDAGDGTGVAQVEVTADSGGTVTLGFKPDPLSHPIDINFDPVVFAAGAATESEIRAGQIAHSVCIAVNARGGTLAGNPSIANTATVSTQMPAGQACPTELPGGSTIAGYANVEWLTATETESVPLTYTNSEGTAVRTMSISLTGQAFPGYDIVASAPTSTATYISYVLTVTYPSVGVLSSGPASSVSLTQRFIPEGSPPSFIGSSTGGAADAPVTDVNGQVTVFFDFSVLGTWIWFVSATDGEDTQLSDLVIST